MDTLLHQALLLFYPLVLYPGSSDSIHTRTRLLYSKKKEKEAEKMPRYVVTLTDEEKKDLKALIQKGGKGYRIKHAQILLKLDKRPEK